MKRIIAFLVVSTLLCSFANAATVLVNEGKVDTRTEALASNSSRLTNVIGYNPSWPGTHGGSHYSGVTAPWAYSGAYTHDKVFGMDCDDLLYIDYNNTASVNAMLYETQMGLSTNDIFEWNGYLFALCSGNKVKAFTDESEYYQYGNGKTMTYSGVKRNDSSGLDSYLYVFDISRGAHYSEALIGKWTIEELGLKGASSSAKQVMSKITVDENYIYITTIDNNDRFLSVLKNNISRENPDYIEGTITLKVPQRMEDPAVIAGYPYGGKMICDYSEATVTYNSPNCTRAINGVHIFWFEQTYPFSATNSKNDKMFYLTEVKENGEYVEVLDTKIHYSQENNLVLDNASKAPLASIMQYEQVGTWNDVTSPKVNATVNDGELMYTLLSYQSSDMTVYNRIYVTDWSNPLTPKNITMYEWVNEGYTAAVAGGTVVSPKDYLYYYDGYFYISGDYGITIVKAKDETGEFNMEYVSYIPYDEATTGVVHKATLIAVGNYLILRDNYGENARNGNASPHWGNEAKILLESDKSAVKSCASFGYRYRQYGSVTGNAVVVYGNRVYVGTSPHATSAAMTGMVEVVNFEKTAPLELSIEPMGDVVTVPYKISGKSFGLNSVQLTVNGEVIDVPTTAGEGNYKVWEYVITEPGEYEIDAVGAILKGYPNEATREHISFTATVGGEIEYTATYDETILDDMSADLAVMPILRNNNFTGSIWATPAVGVYSGTTQIAFIKGEKVLISAGEDVDFETFNIHIPSEYGEYSVRIYLLGGVEEITPLTPAVTIKDR